MNEKSSTFDVEIRVSTAIFDFGGVAKWKGVWGIHQQADLYILWIAQIYAC